MADLYVKGSVVGDAETREYNFLVVSGVHHIRLPQSDIEALGLKFSLFARTTYAAGVHFGEGYIELDVLPAELPAVGVAVLRDLGYEIALEEKTNAIKTIRVPEIPLTIHRGLLPWVSQSSDDRVYLTSDDGQVYGLDVRNPDRLFKSSLPEGSQIAHLAMSGDSVYVVSDAGFVYVLGAGNLDVLWHSRLLEGRTITHLAVADRRVYLTLANGWVYALHGGNLELEWHSRLLEGRAITHLAVACRRIYLTLADGWVYALHGGNLEMLWCSRPLEDRKITYLATGGGGAQTAFNDA